MNESTPRDVARVVGEIIEPRRREAQLSYRSAAERAHLSESTWRELAAAGTEERDWRTAATVTHTQLLDMAQAVGCLEEVAEQVGAAPSEVAAARSRVKGPDAGEREILASRNFTSFEKLELLKALQRVRATDRGTRRPPS